MQYIGCDSESVAFSPGDMAPDLVCIQYQTIGTADAPAYAMHDEAVRRLRGWLRDPDVTLVLHNAAYDAVVWCAAGLTQEVFHAYGQGRVLCTWVFERLGEIAGYSARKKLDLKTCCKAHGISVDGLKGLESTDEAKAVAQSFGQFRHAAALPEPHLSYALGDCVVGKLFQRQARRFHDIPMAALQSFSRTMFACQLMSVWGLTANQDLTEAFAVETRAELERLQQLFTAPDDMPEDVAADGGYFLRPDGSCAQKDRLHPYIERVYGAACPRTPTGKPQASALILAESGDPRLEAFATYKTAVKADRSDVPMLRAGRLHPRYGIADTGRTTCAKPNVQNLPGDGPVREAIQPAKGYAFLERDYSGVELCSFAAVAARELDDWSMADTINQSGDPGYLHAVVGGMLLGCSAEELLRRRKAGDELAENARTRGKNANFGFIGGLGHKSYVDYIRLLSKGKLILTEAESKAIKDAWAGAVPAGPRYLRWVGKTERIDGTYEAVIPGSGITRRGMWYCAAANCRFQGLAAAVMHEAMWRLAVACYVTGALPDTHPALFVHDAFILETPIDTLHDVDAVFDRILQESAEAIMPEVRTKSEGHAALSLAKRVRGQKVGRTIDARGRLTVWTPRAA